MTTDKKMEHFKLLQEYQSKLLNLKRNKYPDVSTLQKIEDLEGKVQLLRKLIKEKKNTFLIQTKDGYLTKNGKFTNNKHFAYVFEGDEAINKARQVKGWLVERE